MKLSKSKGAKEDRAGTYIGWNDTRTWSLQSLRDRGILREAIREFCVSMGLTKSNSTVAVDVLYSINRKLLDKCPRYFFVDNPVQITIRNAPKINAKIPLHPSEKLGNRNYKTNNEFFISKKDYDQMDEGNYRLMHLLNAELKYTLLTKEKEFNYISEEPDPNLGTRFVHWLPAKEKNVQVTVRMPDNSLIQGYGEPELAKLKIGTIIQFERFGFVRLYKFDKKRNEAEFWFAHG